MHHYKKLVGKKCYLSPCTVEDADHWLDWFNDLEVTLPLGDEAYEPYSPDRARADASRGDMFSILDLEADTLIGRCLLFGVDHVNRSAMLGIVIGDKRYWSKGYGQEAITLLLDHAFTLLNLNSVMLGVFAYNERAIRCYKKVGFKEIGRRRQARIIGSKKYDAVLMDILAEEFTSPYVSTLID